MMGSADSPSAEESGPDVHHSIGALTRQLHNALQALGLTDRFKDLAGELPDAKSRLSYISRLTGEAAETVLSRVELAKADHAQVLAAGQTMAQRLMSGGEAAPSASDMLAFLGGLDASIRQADEHLTEIMLAQGFHDLTGQVIAKVVVLASSLEDQLVQLLIQTAPPEAVPKPPSTGGTGGAYVPALSGPVIHGQDNPDVVSGQSEVDELLASLGF